METPKNADDQVIEHFGHEWTKFDHSDITEAERQPLFDEYFNIFPWAVLPPKAVGFDLGCGTGRWAVAVAPRVSHLHCVDPSSAIDVAKHNLRNATNCTFHHTTVEAMPFADDSMDFGYSVGVLHHVPDTQRGLIDCVRKLKRGAPFLVYLYYAFDNQPRWYRALWKLSDLGRRFISSLPPTAKYWLCQLIALIVYWPLGRTATLLKRLGFSIHSFPLGAYWNRSFYTMRTDALDKFGTSLEKRFTQSQIRKMMEIAGLDRIQFSSSVPFWCAVGFKK